jgi:predicted ATPase
MLPAAVQLVRLVVAHYKSIRRVELAAPANLMVLVGPNNAGKSNFLDCLVFLSEATRGFDHALGSRGGQFTALLHKKQPELQVEVLLEFALSDESRAGYIAELFRHNRALTVDQVMASEFLRRLMLRVVFGAGQFTEELTATNLSPGAPACLVFQIRGNRSSCEQLGGQLEAHCALCTGDLPQSTVMLSPGGSNLPAWRLFLGQPDGAAGFPVSHALAGLVHAQLATLQWIAPARNLASRVPIHGQMDLTPNASNLPDVLHWLHNNKPRQFRRIETEVSRLVPRLGRLYTPTFDNATTLGVIDDEEGDLTFTMDQMSYGTKSVIAIVAKVMLAPPGTWLCIEEPETHLHPQAQLLLFDFLRRESADRRILVATHSTAIAAATPLESLFVVERDAANCTVVEPVHARNAPAVIQQLGVQPTLDFEADAIVFVEQPEHVAVFEVWAERLLSRAVVQFLEAEGGSTLRYLANTRIALSPRVHTLVYLVLGRSAVDQPAACAAKERLIKQLELPPRHVITLDTDELERYLLDAPAIRQAFAVRPGALGDLESRLAQVANRPEPRKALAELLQELKLGPYDAPAAARIAAAVDPIPQDVAALFDRIQADARPFWTI